MPKELLLVKKVNSVEEINSLSEKVDALMKLVASKSAPIDFNDMHLSNLTEKISDKKLSYSWFKFMDDHTKNLCGVKFCF